MPTDACRVCLQLREKYIKDEDMSDTKATYKSIRKALATLNDPFTRFLEPAQFAALRRGTAGAVTGVGLEIGFESRDIDSRVVVSLRSQPSTNFSSLKFTQQVMKVMLPVSSCAAQGTYSSLLQLGC